MRVVVGLGSNLGSRWALITAAMNELEARFGETQRSSFVRTRAMTWEDAPPGPDFLNAAMSFECQLPLQELLVVTQSLEQLFGRKHTARWGNRTLDIDILWAPMSCDSPRVPHLGFLERNFALGPALEVDRELRAEHGERLQELGGMPPILLPPLVERTSNYVHVRRAMDESDALAIAWGATAQDTSDSVWVESPASTPLCAASACIDTAAGHLIKPVQGRWALESLSAESCVLRALEPARAPD